MGTTRLACLKVGRQDLWGRLGIRGSSAPSGTPGVLSTGIRRSRRLYVRLERDIRVMAKKYLQAWMTIGTITDASMAP